MQPSVKVDKGECGSDTSSYTDGKSSALWLYNLEPAYMTSVFWWQAGNNTLLIPWFPKVLYQKLFAIPSK